MAHREILRQDSRNGEQESGLRALVALANADLETAPADDLRALVKGLLTLLPGVQPFGGRFAARLPAGTSAVVYLPRPDGETFDEAAARDALRGLAPPVRYMLAVATTTSDKFIFSGFHPLDAEFFATSSANGRPCVTVTGAFRDVVLLRALNLLVHPIVHARLRRCPECDVFFFRVKRQAFCSERCKSRVNFRRRQERGLSDEQRLRRAERAHKYYEQKQRRLLGPRTKVQRRPRLKLRPKSRPRRKTR